MAATVKALGYTAGTFDFSSTASTAPIQEILTELQAWMTTVNSNPSNTNRQCTILKNRSSATGTVYGWVVRAADTTYGNIYSGYLNTSTSNLAIYNSTAWTDDGGNSGYGTFSGTTANDTAISYYRSGQDATYLIGYSTTDTQEFFLLGWLQSTTSAYQDYWLLYKDTNGRWAVLCGDAAVSSLVYYDDIRGVQEGNTGGPLYNGNTGTFWRYSTFINPATAAGTVQKMVSVIANPDVLTCKSSFTLGAVSSSTVISSTDRLISFGAYAPTVRYTPI